MASQREDLYQLLDQWSLDDHQTVELAFLRWCSNNEAHPVRTLLDVIPGAPETIAVAALRLLHERLKESHQWASNRPLLTKLRSTLLDVLHREPVVALQATKGALPLVCALDRECREQVLYLLADSRSPVDLKVRISLFLMLQDRRILTEAQEKAIKQALDLKGGVSKTRPEPSAAPSTRLRDRRQAPDAPPEGSLRYPDEGPYPGQGRRSGWGPTAIGIAFALWFGFQFYNRFGPHDSPSEPHANGNRWQFLCRPASIEAVDQAFHAEPLLADLPVTRQLLANVLRRARVRSKAATSAHLFGLGQAEAMQQAVRLIANLTAQDPQCVHHVQSTTLEAMQDEVYAAGRRCPCSVVVWDDAEAISSAARSLFKVLFDDNPQHLFASTQDRPDRPPEGGHARTEEERVDPRAMTFLVLSHREPAVTAANLQPLPPSEHKGAALRVAAWAQQDSHSFDLWPHRINHVIRHHIPFVLTPEAPGNKL